MTVALDAGLGHFLGGEFLKQRFRETSPNDHSGTTTHGDSLGISGPTLDNNHFGVTFTLTVTLIITLTLTLIIIIIRFYCSFLSPGQGRDMRPQ